MNNATFDAVVKENNELKAESFIDTTELDSYDWLDGGIFTNDTAIAEFLDF